MTRGVVGHRGTQSLAHLHQAVAPDLHDDERDDRTEQDVAGSRQVAGARRWMNASVAWAHRSASVAATWNESPGSTSSSESGIVSCQARVSSTLASPLPSVVMTRVGQVIFGTSARMSAQAMVPMKPTCVETAQRPMNRVHHSLP